MKKALLIVAIAAVLLTACNFTTPKEPRVLSSWENIPDYGIAVEQVDAYGPGGTTITNFYVHHLAGTQWGNPGINETWTIGFEDLKQAYEHVCKQIEDLGLDKNNVKIETEPAEVFCPNK